MDVRSTLSAILGISLVGVVNSDDTYQDFVYQVRTPKLGPVALAAPVMVEIQPDIGGNTDPTVQLSFSYRKYHSLPEVCTSDHLLLVIFSLIQVICCKKVVAKNSCCPTFLIGLAGPCLTIMGAVFGT